MEDMTRRVDSLDIDGWPDPPLGRGPHDLFDTEPPVPGDVLEKTAHESRLFANAAPHQPDLGP